MSRDQRPIRECLDQLSKLVKNGASGNFYLAAANHDVGAITILGGVVAAVNFRGRRGDAAVEELKDLKEARWSFRDEQLRSAKSAQLSDDAQQWLIGSATPGQAAQDPSPAAAGTSADRADLERFRGQIESVALSFLGPFAGTLCDGIFADCNTVPEVIDELAGNLPPNEASRFRAVITKALGEA